MGEGTPCVVRRPGPVSTFSPPARATQASPPHTTLPPPLRVTKALPRRYHTISTSKIHPLYMGQQQKMRLRGYGQCKVKAAALTSCARTLYLYQGRRGICLILLRHGAR